MRLRARKIANDLAELLKNQPVLMARAHSVFPRAVNLLFGADELITLTNQDEITPMGLLVDTQVSFRQLLKAGDEVLFEGASACTTSGNLRIELGGAAIWQARVWQGEASQSLERIGRISHQLKEWLAEQPALGLLPLLQRLTECQAPDSQRIGDHFCRYIGDDLEAFVGALSAGDWDFTQKLTDKLIGFGMGSTPSCDDFLAAFLVVLSVAAELYPAQRGWMLDFNQAVARKAKTSTTLISANMLRHAAAGKTSLSHQRLIRACLFSGEDDLTFLASQVMRHGASSGGDFLLGLVCALDWYYNWKQEILKKGEKAQVDLMQPDLVLTI